MATQRYLQARYFATGYFSPSYFGTTTPFVQSSYRYFASGYVAKGYFATGYFGGSAAAPPARILSVGWGPGVTPNARAQFRASPRQVFIAPPTLVQLAGFATGSASTTADLSSVLANGGFGYQPMLGPGVGPFSNYQFQASPRTVVTPGPAFLMAAAAQAVASGTSALSALQLWAAVAQSFASALGSLTTLATSGGVGYRSQIGPGVGPSYGGGFITPPLSTRGVFQSLVGAAVSNAIATGTSALSTQILLALDTTNAMRGMAVATAALTTASGMAANASAAANSAAALMTATRMAASANSVATGTAAPNTGITLAATVTGLSYASAALGSGTTFTVTAAGLASVSAALLTQSFVSAAASAVGSAAAALGTGQQFAGSAGGSANASATLLASIQLSAQATGLATATPVLSGSIVLNASANALASAQGAINSGSQLQAAAFATAYSVGSLQTAEAPYSASARAAASASANLNGNVTLAANANSVSLVTARLLTVLQPPGEFADIRWLRAPRGGDVAYAEFFQGVGEQLWYGVNWEDWLASNWEANSSATLAQAIRPTVPNGLEYTCITAGQTGAVEPIWATFAGGVTVDGTAMWQAQAVTSMSLDDTISSSSFTAPSGITLDSAQVQTLRSYLIIETPAAVVGTDYDVLCTIYTQGGQQKIAKLRIKVR